MDIRCPECLGLVVPMTTTTGRCSTHGGIYRLLFVRAAEGAAAAPTAPSAQAPPAPPQAAGAPPGTAAAAPPARAPAPQLVEPGMLGLAPAYGRRVAPGLECPRHPGVQAVARCTGCQSPLCETCDFSFPGELHFCPDCATSAGTVSARRKRSGLWSVALAIWSSVALVALFVVAAAGGASSKEAEAALGGAFFLAVLIPSIVGIALGIGAIERRQTNPFWIWAAAIWNGLLLAVVLLLSLVGSLMG